MHAVELTRTLAEAAELRDVVHLAVENHHAVIVQAVGNENPAIRQKRHVLRLAEVRAVRALHVLLAQGLQQPAAIIGEDVNRAERFVDDPHAMLGVVRADAQPMRPRAGRALAQGIPLRPPLPDIAVGVEGVEAVAPDAAIRRAEHVDANRARKPREPGRHRAGQPVLTAL